MIFLNCYEIAMPNKYAQRKGWTLKKQKHKVSNWSSYNRALRNRGAIDFWLSEEAIRQWYLPDRIYDGTGTPKLYSDFAIRTCHEVRQVYRLPLRQAQGFINSLFRQMKLGLCCPDFSVLSRRLRQLKIAVPHYKRGLLPDEGIHAIAIDSTGLKRFGRGEWHQEKYGLSKKASWRKLHIAVNQNHELEACVLTDRFSSDDSNVDALLSQIKTPIDHFTADGAYDKKPVYDSVAAHSNECDIVIPPQVNAIYREDIPARTSHLCQIKEVGRMQWQKLRNYGSRNYSELAVQRYQRILGNTMHAREFENQKEEAVIGCSILNKMTSLGMPQSHRIA